MSAASFPKLLTVEEFTHIPDPLGGRYELHHGEAVFVSFPEKPHKAAQRRIRQLLESVAGSLGVVDTEFPYRPLPEHELWGADVAFVSKARYDSYTPWLDGSPELVVEVKSPSNTKQELHDRAMTTLAGACVEFWVADPQKRTVTVYNRQTGMHIYGSGQDVPLTALRGSIAVEEIFGSEESSQISELDFP